MEFFGDIRMSGEAIRIMVVADAAITQYYPSVLFTAEEAHAASRTAKSTIFTANMVAGSMVEQFTRRLR